MTCYLVERAVREYQYVEAESHEEAQNIAYEAEPLDWNWESEEIEVGETSDDLCKKAT